MVGELHCPDCGGIVGATETTEEGDPCRCFVDQSAAVESEVGDRPVEPPPVLKICRICGKDVSHSKRVRSPVGYACYDCDKEEERRLNYGRVRCGACGHLTREESLTDYEGTNICPNCLTERTELKKQQLARMGFKGARRRYETKQVFQLVAVLVVLGVVILIGLYFHHRR